MIRITFSILSIIAAWLFGLPYAWAVTLTVFASLVILQTLIDWGWRLANDSGNI